MKKLVYLFSLLLTANFIFISCSGDDDIDPIVTDPTVTDTGVMIGGARWATRNVDAPGTFAATPTDAGMFFQWNRQRGWPATGTVANWNTTADVVGIEWGASNDPCPPGWRVPTEADFISLQSAGGEYVTVSGVSGFRFGIAPNQVFFPFIGVRLPFTGYLNVDFNAYWSSTRVNIGIPGEEFLAQSLFFINTIPHVVADIRRTGLPVRCVKRN